MNETTHRFLQAIVGRLPEGRIAELRLFPAIRQGGIESAVAVVAVEPPEEVAVVAADASFALDAGEDGFAETLVAEVIVETDADDAQASLEVVVEEVVVVDETIEADAIVVSPSTELADRMAPDPIADALDVEVTRIMADPFSVHAEGVFALGEDEANDGDRETTLGRSVEQGGSVASGIESTGIADAEGGDDESGDALEVDGDAADLIASGEGHVRSANLSDREVVRVSSEGSADAPPFDENERVESIALGDILALPGRVSEANITANAPIDPTKRYAILTASYKLVLKGPDRGKWEVDIVHEADAPLATVERVARGVARRAGDESDPEHFSGDELRHVIEKPSWAATA
ncbi:MAG: hypothetical protein ABIT38_01285 [Gemmatimonadaceae bacterium]